MKQLGVLLLPPGWDASPSKVPNMKQLGVLQLPQDRIPVHHRVPSISLGLLNGSLVPIYTSGSREAMYCLKKQQDGCRDQRPVSQKFRKLLGPAQPFLIICILKTKQCIRMKVE